MIVLWKSMYFWPLNNSKWCMYCDSLRSTSLFFGVISMGPHKCTSHEFCIFHHSICHCQNWNSSSPLLLCGCWVLQTPSSDKCCLMVLCALWLWLFDISFQSVVIFVSDLTAVTAFAPFSEWGEVRWGDIVCGTPLLSMVDTGASAV